jgi:hypothetical protein
MSQSAGPNSIPMQSANQVHVDYYNNRILHDYFRSFCRVGRSEPICEMASVCPSVAYVENIRRNLIWRILGISKFVFWRTMTKKSATHTPDFLCGSYYYTTYRIRVTLDKKYSGIG